MSNRFLVLCKKSPAKAVKRRRPVTGFAVEQRALADDDRIPDARWKKKIVAVVEARGRDLGITPWLEDVAAATDGCVFDDRFDEFTYFGKAEATKRAKRLLDAGDHAQLAAWVRACAPDDSESRRWETVDAIHDVVTRSKQEPRAELVLALHAIYRDDPDIEALVLAGAKAGGEQIAAAAADILARLQEKADRNARMPRTAAELIELFEGAVNGNPSAERRLDRFLRDSRDQIGRLVMKAIADDASPSPAVAAEVVSALHVPGMSAGDRERLIATTHTGSLAIAFRDAAIAWRDAAGQRAAAYSQARFDEYERYREDPLVATPRPRGDDIAMFRGLNDALYGPERDRPQLPLRVVALVCDRRLDEARAAYVELLGELHADAAINDAKEHFAPDLGS